MIIMLGHIQHEPSAIAASSGELHPASAVGSPIKAFIGSARDEPTVVTARLSIYTPRIAAPWAIGITIRAMGAMTWGNISDTGTISYDPHAQGHDLIALIMMGQDEEFWAESRLYGADPFDQAAFL
jgi:hypothetical protein